MFASETLCVGAASPSISGVVVLLYTITTVNNVVVYYNDEGLRGGVLLVVLQASAGRVWWISKSQLSLDMIETLRAV